jgi:alpha-L-arabinofuranosidase
VARLEAGTLTSAPFQATFIPALTGDEHPMQRRDFIKLAGTVLASPLAASAMAGAAPVAAEATTSTLKIDPKPLFDLSPWLYMQFMEPVGVSDSSIEASWDHMRNRWRPELIEITKELAPTMMRWGGLFCGYYRWREGVGPRDQRKPMFNLAWGGIESNQVGTAEFVEFCQQVGADPLMCVNFESEGDKAWAVNARGENRSGNAQEAADWVDYCNNPGNKERIAHGHPVPLPIKVWQLGNETSFSRQRFNQDQAIAKTIEFSRAMRKADPGIKLIGWGDSGWGRNMIERAGEHINYVAFHHLFDPGRPLRENDYRKDPAATWAALMNGCKTHENRIVQMRQQIAPHNFPLALTECHYTPPGRNRCEVLSSWAAGVSYARFLNIHERHGDLLKIANIADFCGTRWQTNAIMLTGVNGKPFMMPVAKVMALYRKHAGRSFVGVSNVPQDLDITASRTDNTIYLHIVNTDRTRARSLNLAVDGFTLRGGKAFTIAAEPEFEIMSSANDPMLVRESNLPATEPISLPPASVSALEIAVEAAPEARAVAYPKMAGT